MRLKNPNLLMVLVLFVVIGHGVYIWIITDHHRNTTTTQKLINEEIFFYNRVPKTGSENLIRLTKVIVARNNVSLKHFWNPRPRRDRDLQSRRKYVDWVLHFPRPLVYTRHCYFVNFEQFGYRNPVWFSMVRDPFETFVSGYYYHRQAEASMYDRLRVSRSPLIDANVTKEEWRHKSLNECILKEDPECHVPAAHDFIDLIIPYFCGMADFCAIRGSREALDQAKRNIEMFYPLVGVLEFMVPTLELMEDMFPKFFSGIKDLYVNELREPHKNIGRYRQEKEKPLSEKATEKLKNDLSLEYELYDFLVDRLKQQHASLKARS